MSVCLGLSVVAAVGAACSSSTPAAQPSSTTTATDAGTGSAAGALALQSAYVEVIRKVRPSVVEIQTDTGLGSGVVYDTKGDVVTNYHVVQGANTLQVTTADGRMLDASLVGTYPPDDLAVVRMGGGPLPPPATFGNSQALVIGDVVLAIGNPLGLSSSATDGIVSYNGRVVAEGNGVVLANTVQTSAPINPGNSGGALVDLAAEVIGIPTLAASNQQEGGAAAGIGFAIPSNTVKLIAPQLISTGKVSDTGRAALGVGAGDAVAASGQGAGAVIVQVAPGGPAAMAGLSAGDVITSVNGTRITGLADLQAALAGLSPGQTVSVTVTHPGGAQQTVNLKLGTLPGT